MDCRIRSFKDRAAAREAWYCQWPDGWQGNARKETYRGGWKEQSPGRVTWRELHQKVRWWKESPLDGCPGLKEEPYK